MSVDFRLYLITDRKVAAKPLPEAVRLALESGVRAVQLREKDLPIRDLLALAQELRTLTREFGARLLVNDRVDVAIAVDADGVHLGGQSMPVSAVRKLVSDRMLIGASAHSRDEALEAARQGADFITFGPVFETLLKLKYGYPVGIELLKTVVSDMDIPVFALGGIKSGNMRQVFGSGCHGVAMISSILAASDIGSASKGIVEGICMIEKIICRECGRR